MKLILKLLLVIVLVCISNVSSAQTVKICYNVGGYWNNWVYSVYNAYGHYDNFVLCSGTHPSIFTLRIVLSNYQEPDKKTIKEHKKNNIWYTYNGIVEYWVCDKYPTIESVLKGASNEEFPFIPNPESGLNYNQEWGRRVKRTANATIKIAPYDKLPRVYNLYFDNVGVGIELR